MGLAKPRRYLLVEDYLAGENDGDVRHEYVDGEVYAISGSSDRHNRIAGNIFARVFSKVSRSGRCQVFMRDMKLRADEVTFYYPDVFVACDNPDPYFRREPILVVEVLSPSTELVDRREKLRVYRNIPSLREYLIVSQDKLEAELHYKDADGQWFSRIFTTPDEVVELVSVELSLSLAEIFAGVEFQ